MLAIPLIALIASLLVVLLRRCRHWLRGFVAEMAVGGAILRTPGRYIFQVMVPTLLAFALRWGVTGTLLLAFGISPSLETLLRVNVSHGLARTVQVTPGGFGTTQAFDLVALRGIAPVEVITAYSLSQAAILLVFNIAFGLVALTWAFGWDRTARLMRLPGRHAGRDDARGASGERRLSRPSRRSRLDGSALLGPCSVDTLFSGKDLSCPVLSPCSI